MRQDFSLQVVLPYEVETPYFEIGLIVQIDADTPLEGMITGLKLISSTWSYLVCSGKLERWVSEEQILPVDAGDSIIYRDRWEISSKDLGIDPASKSIGSKTPDGGFIFRIRDRYDDLDSNSLRFYDSPIAALIAGKAFLDREFPAAEEAEEQEREAA